MEITDLPPKYQEQARAKIKATERGKCTNRPLTHEEDKPRCMKRLGGKYGNIKTEVDGIIFDSKRESKRYKELKQLETVGIITDLRLQVPFELIPTQKDENGKMIKAVKYIADFTYNEDGKCIVEDCKGKRTDVYIIKKKLMLFRHGITIRET